VAFRSRNIVAKSVRVFHEFPFPDDDTTEIDSLSNVWFADATYIMLKPIEYAAITVRMASGISAGDVNKIHRKRVEGT
jgi:hypothetical protein